MPPDTVEIMIRTLRARFVEAGIESAALDARLIVQAGLGLTHEEVIALQGRKVKEKEKAGIATLARRRECREPVSRILGEREFYGRSFRLSSATLDPRPATETLVDVALKIAAEQVCGEGQIRRFVDLGTGTGAIAISLLAELSSWEGIAIDISACALETARANAVQHGVLDRLSLIKASWLDSLTGRFDLSVCNPPYISSSELETLAPEVRLHDPAVALDGGADGLGAYRAVAANARKCLKLQGFLCLEIGRGQERAVEQIMAEGGMIPAFAGSGIGRDLTGTLRVLTFVVSQRMQSSIDKNQLETPW